MGRDAKTIFNSLPFDTATHKTNYKKVIEKFDSYFMPKVNVIHERAKFHSRVQQHGETVETYIRVLYELAKNCEFAANKDDMIRDRLVVGISDKDCSQKLQWRISLTLEEAITMVRDCELVKEQLQQQALNRPLIDAVNHSQNEPANAEI